MSGQKSGRTAIVHCSEASQTETILFIPSFDQQLYNSEMADFSCVAHVFISVTERSYY